MLFEPIEGNGWYVGDTRINPPNPFKTQIDGDNSATELKGVVIDLSSEYYGCTFSASPRFFDDAEYYAIVIYRRGNLDTKSCNILATGDVVVHGSKKDSA